MDFNNYYAVKDEMPLDRIVNDGGFCGIFSTICCIGDSLSSGEFQTVDNDGQSHYYDLYQYSWGQYISRMTGSKVYNFSKGGMTAEEYCESFADQNGFWAAEKAAQAYIIALGVNEIWQNKKTGSAADIVLENYRHNGKSFAGYYAQIIQRIKKTVPDAKFFFVTQPREETDTDECRIIKEEQRKVLYGFAELFENAYVIDLYRYAPVYDKKFKETFYLNGHMGAAGYMLTAKIISSYIDYIIRNNQRDFIASGLIGTGIDAGVL